MTSSTMLRWTTQTTLCILKNSQRAISSVKPIASEKIKEDGEKAEPGSLLHNEEVRSVSAKSYKSKLVLAAFASLKSKTLPRKDNYDPVDEQISNARTPEALLSLTNVSAITKRQAQKIVSILAEWSIREPLAMTDFESDPRFISLCQQLNHDPVGKGTFSTEKQRAVQQNDLSVVLGITGDEEAAKLISTISVPQMIKVLVSLAGRKRRSTLLLRSLSFNIASSTEKLNIKQGADILYCLATLNFPDEVLLEKVCHDLCECVAQCQKTAVIGSIATSLGLLKYKDIGGLLDNLCDWVVHNKDLCRMQDITSLLLTMATLSHIPSNADSFYEFVIPLFKDELPNPLPWLDAVWSLVVLGRIQTQHYKSVLNEEFLDRLAASQNNVLSISCKRKILNINGAAKWTKGYDGPLLGLETHDLKSLPLGRTKAKQALVTTVFETLSNLLPSAVYLRTNIDTGMGFLLDGECLVNSKMTPLPVIDRKTGEPLSLTKPQKGTRIAIMVWDYHDHTRGKTELIGAAIFTSSLLVRSGYRVLSVPYTEFCPKDKLTTRVQYLEKQLKTLIHPG